MVGRYLSHVGAGIRKQASWTQRYLRRKILNLESCSRISACTYTCVRVVVCMYNVCTHVITFHLITVGMVYGEALQLHHM